MGPDEADSCFEGPCTSKGKTFPLASTRGSNGCAVTAATCTAAGLSALVGRYLFGDYCSGRIWAVSAGGAARQRPVLLEDTSLAISTFGEDEAGEVYVVDYEGGRLFRLAGS